MAVKNYDPKNVTLTLNGLPVSGFNDGTFITLTQNQNLYETTTGADDEVVRTKNNDRSATLTINLLRTSSANDTLSSFYQADSIANNGVFTLILKDNNGRTTFFSGAAWVMKLPDMTFSTENEPNVWEIALARNEGFIGGTDSVA
jgi:hypothetical protein